MRKKELIPEVNVYCDRWCERCPFTERCAVFDPADKEKDWPAMDAHDFFKEIAATFEKTMNLLKDEADAHGMNWNQLVADAKEVELEEPILPAEHEALIKLAGNYRLQVAKWLELNSDEIEATTSLHAKKLELGIKNAEKNNILFVDAVETIQWYYALIEAKLRRAINSLNSNFEDIEDHSLQSHANGCAKITMIFVTKSIQAWERVSAEMTEHQDGILDHLAILTRLSNSIQKIFPAHETFIRPGFDTFIF